MHIDDLKPFVPLFIKKAVKAAGWSLRAPTRSMRLLPDFIVIGAQKCGTTSLYHYLKKHPCISMASQQEVHYFDLNYGKGTDWYRAHFPASLSKNLVKQMFARDLIIGESSPYYIFHPAVPQRISELLPEVKLIALLRNPVERAQSHYYHEVRKGRETLSFEAAIQKEAERLAGVKEKLLEDERYYNDNYRNFSYVSRSVYIDQLETWARFFPRDQFLIIKSEDFYDDPETTLKQVSGFLNLKSFALKAYKKYNYAAYSNMDTGLRKQLTDYFEQYNQRLYEFLGISFDW